MPHLTQEQRRERAAALSDEALDRLSEELRTGTADDYLYGLALAHFEILAGAEPTDFYQREIYKAAHAALEELREKLAAGKLPALASFLASVVANTSDFHEIADEMGWERLSLEEDEAAMRRLEASRDYR